MFISTEDVLPLGFPLFTEAILSAILFPIKSAVVSASFCTTLLEVFFGRVSSKNYFNI